MRVLGASGYGAPTVIASDATRALIAGNLRRQTPVDVFAGGAGLQAAAASGGILFNLTTNGNAQLLAERFHGLMSDPATLGLLLAQGAITDLLWHEEPT